MNKGIFRIGEVSVNNKNEKMVIIKYRDANDISIEFDDGTIVEKVSYRAFKLGQIKNPNSPSVYNKGYLGQGKYKARDRNKSSRVYDAWHNMLTRCYNRKYQEGKPTYIGCEVSEEFLNFQRFAEFYINETWCDNICLIPDKDILCHEEDKMYSKETVLLVDMRINSLFTKTDGIRGKYPIGVSFDGSKYLSKCYTLDYDGNKTVARLGRFDAPEEAFYAYKEFKEQYIKQVADEYREKYPNFPKKLYDAMYSYQVLITD